MRTCHFALEGSLINRATIIIQTRTDIPGSAATGDSFRHETLHMLSHHGAARAHRVKTRPPSLVLSSGSPRAPHGTVHAACPRNGRETCAFTRLQPPRRSGGAMPPCSLLSPTVLCQHCQPVRSVALGRVRRLLAAPREPSPLRRAQYVRRLYTLRTRQPQNATCPATSAPSARDHTWNCDEIRRRRRDIDGVFNANTLSAHSLRGTLTTIFRQDSGDKQSREMRNGINATLRSVATRVRDY